MSKRSTGGRRAAAAMVRAAEGLHVRSDGPDAARAVNVADDAPAAETSNEAEAARRPDAQPPQVPSGSSGAVYERSRVSISDTSADAQGNLALPVERRRWDSLVTYPADKAVSEAAHGAASAMAGAAGETAGATDVRAAEPAASSSSAAHAAADDAAER